MRTEHDVYVGDSRDLGALADGSVELVVTSPPYPMIEMWDDVFAELNPEIKERLAVGDGAGAFRLMHAALGETWEEVSRVLVDGGIACVNIGDATRKLDGDFRVYQNHAEVIRWFDRLGFVPLPDILWRKPVNSAAKFMGSGMLPTNAYATLEHEYILVFRKGSELRSFASKDDRRYSAAYFWEERNSWFSDMWTDIMGASQEVVAEEVRDRSGAFPFGIPYRLINMYSVYGDTVLDPFWGTGTTTMAAMVAGRDSVGSELQEEFVESFRERVRSVASLSREVVGDRIAQHKAFVSERECAGDSIDYDSEHYSFPVMTKQERQIQFYVVDAVREAGEGFVVEHSSYDDE